MEPTDVELLDRARAGDSAAFGRLFRRHADAVHNHCFRRLGSSSAAEDATSLVFLETWRARSRAVGLDGSLLPWLLGVATNVVRNQARSARRFDAALHRLDPAATAPDHADAVAARLDDERRMRPVLATLATLPAGEQDAVALVYLSGLSYAEAAVALSVPVGTIRSRLSRARRRLTDAAAASGGAVSGRASGGPGAGRPHDPRPHTGRTPR